MNTKYKSVPICQIQIKSKEFKSKSHYLWFFKWRTTTEMDKPWGQRLQNTVNIKEVPVRKFIG